MFGDLKPKSLAHCNLRPDAAHVAEAVLGTALDESSVRLMEREVWILQALAVRGAGRLCPAQFSPKWCARCVLQARLSGLMMGMSGFCVLASDYPSFCVD